MRVFELREVVGAVALGEFVVDGERLGRGDRLDRHVELRLAAGELARRVGLGEGRLDLALLAGGDAEQLLLEAGDEGVAADHHLDVLARAALERFAVNRADEVDGDAVELLRLAAFRPIGVDAAVLSDPLQPVLDLAVLDFGERAARWRCR